MKPEEIIAEVAAPAPTPKKKPAKRAKKVKKDG